jgi:hypothetical protein
MELDLRLALMSGIDIPIPECQLVLHQPTIKEIAYIGEKNFFVGVQCLNIRKSMISQGESLLADTNNFQIFMTVMAEPSEVEKKEAVKQVLQLLFPSYKVSFTPRSLLFVGTELTATVDEMNFEALQQVVRQALCVNSGPMDQQTFNPANEKAREIAEKLMRGRQRVAALKGEDNASIFAQYLSILTVGLESMSLHDCLNLTMYQLFDLMERYSLYVNWDIDIRSRLAGGKPDNKPDNWMKNIH